MKEFLKKYFVVGLCFILATLVSLFFFTKQKPVAPSPDQEASLSGTLSGNDGSRDPLAPFNVLLLGYGGAGHDGDYLSDTIIFLKVIPLEKRVLMFNIPRDLWVELDFLSQENKPYYSKVNRVYSIGLDDKNYSDKPAQFTGKYGGGEAAKAVIGKLVGEEIDFFVGADFNSFQRILAMLAGSDGLLVDVPYTFTDEFYPIDGKEDDPCGFSETEIAKLASIHKGYALEKQFSCRYETVHFELGQQRLKPDEALKFVRSRHSQVGGNDFGRSQRQQALLTALKNEVLTPAFLIKLPALFSELNKSLTTNFGLGDLTHAIGNYGDPRSFNMESYVIDNNLLVDSWSFDKQAILLPRMGQGDYSEIQAFIQEKSASSSAQTAI